MNVKFLNPFVEAAYEVLKAETNLDIARGQLGLQKEAFVTDDVTVIISLVGDVEGNVYYGMSYQTATNLVSMMISETLDTFDELAQSGSAELGNVITGRASVKLSENGFEATISPPTLLQGKGARISTLDVARIVVPLQTSAGNLLINLGLRESATQGTKAAHLPVPDRPQINS